MPSTVKNFVTKCSIECWTQMDSLKKLQDRDHWQTLVNMVMNLWVLVPQSYLLT
jgi:hypothetical protein